MTSPEVIPEQEKGVIECHDCKRVYDPTKSFQKVRAPNQTEVKSFTEYLVAKCPSCGILDTTLFDWSAREIKKRGVRVFLFLLRKSYTHLTRNCNFYGIRIYPK